MTEVVDERRISWPILVGLFFIAVFLGGGIGMIVFSSCMFLSQSRFAVDKDGKHGIARSGVSRLGGVAILFGVIFYLAIQDHFKSNFLFLTDYGQTSFLFEMAICSLLIASIGFFDDFKQIMPPLLKISLMFFLSVLGFWMFGEMQLSRSPIQMVNGYFAFPAFSLVCSSFVLIGFANAGNVVDGANGLLSLIACFFFGVAFYETSEMDYLLIFLAVAVFAVINLTWGQIILGDFGAYWISAMIVLCSFRLFNELNTSIWFFASILSYPCFEIVRITIYRIFSKKSPLVADNSHLHNSFYAYIKGKVPSANGANSITGTLLALLSCGVPTFAIFIGNQSTTSSEWFSLWAFQIGLFAVLTFLFGSYGFFGARSNLELDC